MTAAGGTACQIDREAGGKDISYVATTGGKSAPVNRKLTKGREVAAVNTTTFDSWVPKF